ncbi:hypothetical protein JCM3770_005631 [Rhodotorula araucariae]
MSHSHSHTHTHDAHSGGHGHTHASSPYDRSCQAPTSAATYAFVCAFVGALAAVSLPTHVTGYFLPSVVQTSLLWCTVGSSAAYAAACVACFFGVMEESVSEGFQRPKVAQRQDRRERHVYQEDKIEREWEGRMQQLKSTSWAASGLLALTVTLSIALFALALRYSLPEWTAWCARKVVVEVQSSASEETRDTAVQRVCEEMHLNQTYLVLGVPGFLALLEILRSSKTAHFLAIAADRPNPPQSASPSPIELTGEAAWETAFARGAQEAQGMEQQ